MKNVMKKGMSLLLVLLMVISLLPQLTLQSSAANVNYVYSGNYVYNWGQRGTTATFMSPMAESFYAKYNESLDSLSSLSGSSTVSSVPSSDLYTRLKTLMTTAHSYKTSYDATKNLYKYTDCQNSGGKISSFYSGTSIGPGWGEGGSWNREHTWPNSKGLGGQDENDIMMLRPTATSENSSRGNTAYGKGGSFYDPNEESGGKYNLHGDVARIMLYTYVRWGNTSYMWGSSGVMESKAVLLEWMAEDPVDTWELGRNDAVQSITGTRNVFVDYPELAFELFEAEVPAGYDTPSGGTVSYTFTATPNNSSYGYITVSGNQITAYPHAGYAVSGYKVTSGSATVTQSGNVFTVKPTSDCIIQILFTAKTAVTLTFIDRGSTVSTLSGYAGDKVKTPAYRGTLPKDFVFRGWTEQQVVNSAAKPDVLQENADMTLSASKTYYALYGKVEAGGTGEAVYSLATSSSQLFEGASVIIAASGTNPVAMKTIGVANNRYAGTVTKNADNTISFTEDVLIDILTLGAGSSSGTYSLFSETNGKYLAAGTDSSNKLVLQSSVDNCASFQITVNSAGTASMISQTTGEKNSLRYNSSANVFACYSTGQKDVSLYVKQGGGVAYYTTSPVECDHNNTVGVAATGATCTEIGYTAGIFCNDCSLYISGHETVDALGHSYSGWVVIQDPSCTTAGTEKKTCSRCDDVQTQSVAATGHSMDAGVVTTKPTCTASGIKTFTCSKCGHTTTQTVAPTGHNYINGTCTGCGDTTSAVPGTYTKITSAEEFTSGKYVMVVSTGYAPGVYDDGWTTAVKPVIDGDTVTDAKGGIWTVTVDGSSVYLKDSNELFIGPASGNTNDLKNTEYPWAWSFADGSFTFSGTGSDTTKLASNTGAANKFRAYKNTTASNTKTYPSAFTLYKLVESVPVPEGPVASWNLILGSDIGVNFIMNLTEDQEFTGVTVNGERVSYDWSGNVISVHVAAAQMTDEIAILINDEPLETTYTVAGYADTILKGNYPQADKNLVANMLLYGGAAQTYFSYHTERLANSDAVPKLPADEKLTLEALGSVGDIKFYGASLLHKEKLGVRLYFTGDIAGLDMTVKFLDVPREYKLGVNDSGLGYIEINGINPHEIYGIVDVEISNAAGELLLVNYSPMDYILRTLNKAGDTEQLNNLKTLVTALYSYYKAASAYAG